MSLSADPRPGGRDLPASTRPVDSMDFAAWEPDRSDPGLRAGAFAAGGLPRQDGSEVLLMSPASIAGLLTEAQCFLADPGCLQGPGQVLDLRSGLGTLRGGSHQAICPVLHRHHLTNRGGCPRFQRAETA